MYTNLMGRVWRRASLGSLCLMLAAPASLAAPDGDWEWPDQGLSFGGFDAWVNELLVWDDGSGAALYVGGVFKYAGSATVNSIARWDGNSWKPLGDGFEGYVLSIFPFDDGLGSDLYVGGSFSGPGGTTNIAKWNGASWAPLGVGTPGTVLALVVHDDGTGTKLFVAGSFKEAGGKPMNRIAAWDGTSWGDVGGGLNATVLELAVYDDGGGPALYAAGPFSKAGGVPAFQIAKWDGKMWSGVGGGVSGGLVEAMTAFDDGTGAKLFVSGEFTEAGGIPVTGIVTWNGQSWGKADAGLSSSFPFARDFAVTGSGNKAVLYGIGGKSAARWERGAWKELPPIGQGFGSPFTGAFFDDGAGPRLHVGGYNLKPGSVQTNIARWSLPLGGTLPCGDLTGDGFVNQQDLGILLGDFGCAKGVGLCPGDCDNDGDTDQIDLGILLSNWGLPCP